MKTQANEAVVVVAIGGEPTSNLRGLCDRHGWRCMVANELLEVVRSVRRSNMLVIIVEVAPARDRCMELIGKLTTAGNGATVIAVAAPHASDIETQARAAGAHWYVPSADEPGIIEQMVSAILEEHEIARGRAPTRVMRPTETVSSSPPLREKAFGRRGLLPPAAP